jgi:hypothetical protein
MASYGVTQMVKPGPSPSTSTSTESGSAAAPPAPTAPEGSAENPRVITVTLPQMVGVLTSLFAPKIDPKK